MVLKNNNGDAYTLPAELFGKHAFGRSVAAGSTQSLLTCRLAMSSGKMSRLSRSEGKNNLLKLGVIVKSGLLAAVNQQSSLVGTAQYYNASAAKRTAYDQAYQAARKL